MRLYHRSQPEEETAPRIIKTLEGNGGLNIQPRDPKLFIMAAAVFGAFAVFIVIAQLAGGRRIKGIWRMYAAQVLTTGWLLGSAWIGGWWFLLAMVLTAAATSHEMAGVVRRLGPRVSHAWVIVASVAYCLAAALPDPLWYLSGPLVFALLSLLRPLFASALEGAFERAAASLLATIYPGLCLAFGVRLAGLGNGLGDIVYLYAVLEINDACASLVGRLAGRRPYAPRLSPRKTVEGAAAGLVAAIVTGALLSFLLPGVHMLTGALFGLTLGAFGQAADLAASAIKRQAGLKDFANTIPTQGGILDVYDAFIFALPLWYLLLVLLR